MKSEIIVVEQLPIITERLQEIKAEVTEKVELAMSLVCTPETVVSVKKTRAMLNKEFADFEQRRKDVKNAVMLPYNQFEAVYKDCITDVFKQADADLKRKIDSVEKEIKETKAREILDYFNEYLCASEIKVNTPLYEFITFERANINVTISASVNSLKKQVREFIDRVCDDLNLIETQEHEDEILFEYKQTLNVSSAITTVVNRHKAIAEAKAAEEEHKKKAEAAQEAAAKVETVVETLTPPTTEEPEEILTTMFTVRGTRAQLKALKEFLNKGNYEYV